MKEARNYPCVNHFRESRRIVDGRRVKQLSPHGSEAALEESDKESSEPLGNRLVASLEHYNYRSLYQMEIS